MTGAAANLYAYANNNPVMNVDPNGHLQWRYFFDALVQIGQLVGKVFEFRLKWGAIYFGSRYVAQCVGAYFYNFWALQITASSLTPAAVSQNYPLVIGLLAGMIAIACSAYYFRLELYGNVTSAISDFRKWWS